MSVSVRVDDLTFYVVAVNSSMIFVLCFFSAAQYLFAVSPVNFFFVFISNPILSPHQAFFLEGGGEFYMIHSFSFGKILRDSIRLIANYHYINYNWAYGKDCRR